MKKLRIPWLSRVSFSRQPPGSGGGRNHRNRWQLSNGMGGRLPLEWVADFAWNTQPDIRALVSAEFEKVLDMDLLNARIENEAEERIRTAEILLQRL